MDFRLTTEQQLLRDGLTRFLSARYSLDKSRAAAKTGAGWQPDIWRAFAQELGILDAAMPENDGDPTVNALIICEALGHALVIEPYVETAVIAAGLLHRAGTRAATDLLGRISAGNAVVAIAATERASGDNWTNVDTQARRDGDEWILSGTKTMVVHAPIATHVLISARTSGERTDGAGIVLFAVELNDRATGIDMHCYRTIDDRRAADLVLDELRLPGDALLGHPDESAASLDRARDEGVMAVCAEAVGCMRKVLADTIEYCQQRRQFGQPINTFQVVQHRIVDMHIEVQQAAAAVYLPLLHTNTEARRRARAVAAAKATVGRAARFVGQNAVQLHGAMGMTEELALGHYFKRLTAFTYEYGCPDFHLARYAGHG